MSQENAALSKCGMGLAIVATVLAGCATTVARTPDPLLQADDRCLAVILDAVIVRNGPGSWTADAHWDEYRLRMRSAPTCNPRVTRVRLFDALGRPVESTAGRTALVQASDEIEEEYWKNKMYVEQRGSDAGKYLASAMFHPFGIFLAPVVLAVGMTVTPAVHDYQLTRRQTTLPASVGSDAVPMVAFFPIVPRPRTVEVSYVDDGRERRIAIAAQGALSGLHGPDVKPMAQYPAEAARRGIDEGYVTATLSVSADGDVMRVEIFAASSPVFVEEAKRTLALYKYDTGEEGRVIKETLRFKRTNTVVQRGAY